MNRLYTRGTCCVIVSVVTNNIFLAAKVYILLRPPTPVSGASDLDFACSLKWLDIGISDDSTTLNINKSVILECGNYESCFTG